MFSLSMILVALVVVLYLVYKLIVFVRADADLTLLSKSLKSSYFKDRVVWVTGASSGIGEELCYQLSRLGAKLILSSQFEDQLKIVRKGLSKPNDAHVLPVDLSDPVASRAATEKAMALFGRIDILVNNAGVSSLGVLKNMQESTHRRLMEIDLFAPWILSHDTLPGMTANGFGHIVNMASLAGKTGFARRTSYSAAKFGIIGMMDALRYELVDQNIHVTNVCPGPVRTSVAENEMLHDGSECKKKDPLIEGGMAVERCCQLTLIAVSNQLDEVWLSKQPFIALTCISQYFPTLSMYLMKLQSRKQIAKAMARKKNK